MILLIIVIITLVLVFVKISSKKHVKESVDTIERGQKNISTSKQVKNISLPELGLHFWGDESDEKEIMTLWKNKDYHNLAFKWIDKYEEAWDEFSKGERNDYYKRKCYIYRKNHIATTLMEARQEYEQIGINLGELQVTIYPCDNNCEAECLIKEEQTIPFVEFYNNPTLPCCEDCPCRRLYHCDIIVSQKQ